MKTALAILEFSSKFKGVDLVRRNPHFGNKYAGWQDILHAAQPLLTECGLAHHFTMSAIEGVLFLTLHVTTGEDEITSTLTLDPPTGKNRPQAMGSEITYFKRYLFSAMFNICEAEDDDGNAADVPEVKVIPITDHDKEKIAFLKEKLDYSDKDFQHKLKASFKVKSVDELSNKQSNVLIQRMNKTLKEKLKADKGEEAA